MKYAFDLKSNNSLLSLKYLFFPESFIVLCIFICLPVLHGSLWVFINSSLTKN